MNESDTSWDAKGLIGAALDKLAYVWEEMERDGFDTYILEDAGKLLQRVAGK